MLDYEMLKKLFHTFIVTVVVVYAVHVYNEKQQQNVPEPESYREDGFEKTLLPRRKIQLQKPSQLMYAGVALFVLSKSIPYEENILFAAGLLTLLAAIFSYFNTIVTAMYLDSAPVEGPYMNNKLKFNYEHHKTIRPDGSTLLEFRPLNNSVSRMWVTKGPRED
jgi:hypothetical protein